MAEPKAAQLNVRLTPDDSADLKVLAFLASVSEAEYVRRLVERELEVMRRTPEFRQAHAARRQAQERSGDVLVLEPRRNLGA